MAPSTSPQPIVAVSGINYTLEIAGKPLHILKNVSLKVDPVPGYGAIEDGEHLFYERQGDGPEHLAGRARFTQLWRLTADGWRLARVFSYGHAAAE